MTAEEAALKRYPINQWGIHTTIEDRNLNRLLRESHIEGWNDRDSLVEAEKKELIKKITELHEIAAKYNDHDGNYMALKILQILTPEDK